MRSLLTLFAIFLLDPVLLAQESRPVKCKLVLFESSSTAPEKIYALGTKEGDFTEGKLITSVEASAVQYEVPASGRITFVGAPDPKSPVIATVNIPTGMQNAYLFFFLNPKKDKTETYQVLAIEDSERAMPIGGAMICNLTNQETRIALGEHKYQLPAGRTATMPQPKTRDPYDQCEFSVSFLDKKNWLPLQVGQQRCGVRDRYIIFIYQGEKPYPSMKTYARAVPIANP